MRVIALFMVLVMFFTVVHRQHKVVEAEVITLTTATLLLVATLAAGGLYFAHEADAISFALEVIMHMPATALWLLQTVGAAGRVVTRAIDGAVRRVIRVTPAEMEKVWVETAEMLDTRYQGQIAERVIISHPPFFLYGSYQGLPVFSAPEIIGWDTSWSLRTLSSVEGRRTAYIERFKSAMSEAINFNGNRYTARVLPRTESTFTYNIYRNGVIIRSLIGPTHSGIQEATLAFGFRRQANNISFGLFTTQRCSTRIQTRFLALSDVNVNPADVELAVPTVINLNPVNIVEDMYAAREAVEALTGEWDDVDYIYLEFPQSLLDLLGGNTGVGDVVIPDGGVVAPPVNPPVDEALGGILDAITALPGQLANTMVGTMELDFSRFQNTTSLTMLFPFSIPFDFVRAINSLRVPPKPPRFEIDFTGTVLAGNQEVVWALDLSDFESIAQVVRWTVWISVFIGLMLATHKFIKW